MNVLVIGGSRFMGRELVWRLLGASHRVTLLNRGTTPDPFAQRVERLIADRSTDAFERVVAQREFDAVVDFVGFTAADVQRSVKAMTGQIGHYFFVSTGQVYLVRRDCPVPSREEDYHGELLGLPADPHDVADWRYGIDKRAAEDVLTDAAPGFPSTRVRIPMVIGEGDNKRRFDAYLWRLLDGGPLVLPRADAIARHVDRRAVVAQLVRWIETPPLGSQAFNLAQREVWTVRDVIGAVAHCLGRHADVVEVDEALCAARGIDVRLASPFSTRWMSVIDPSRAIQQFGFAHAPAPAVVTRIVDDALVHWRSDPPAGYQQRDREIALATEVRAQSRPS